MQCSSVSIFTCFYGYCVLVFLVINVGFRSHLEGSSEKALGNYWYGILLASYPLETGRNLNVHKTFRRRPGRLLKVLCAFKLRPVSRGYRTGKIYQQSYVKYLEEINEITSKGTISIATANILFLDGKLDTKLCLQTIFKFS